MKTTLAFLTALMLLSFGCNVRVNQTPSAPFPTLPSFEGGSGHSTEHAADNAPDISTLRNSGFIIGPGDGIANPIHTSWVETTTLMANLDVFDNIVKRIEGVLCSDKINKSVLLVGEPSDTYKYIFARLAMRQAAANCPDMWHVQVDINKIEAGHSYVGQVEEYWEGSILKPADGKDVVLYFDNLNHLIGLGSHSHDASGIEAEYASNINAGRLRSVAFLSKYEYNQMQFSSFTYVLNAHADVIFLEDLSAESTKKLAKEFIKVFEPHLTLSERELNYLMQTVAYFRPNLNEPQRTVDVVKYLITHFGQVYDQFFKDPAIETKHPYGANENAKWEIDMPEAKEIALVFDSFELEKNYDKISLNDTSNSLTFLRSFTGNLGAFTTPFFPTNKMRLTFTSNGTNQLSGFKVKQVIGRKKRPYTFTREDVRRSVLSLAQVPEWIMNRDYTVIRNMPAQLDKIVVGVTEGKRDVIRAMENGYVSGRTDEKPIGTSMFVGPTGTGKSFLAKTVAEVLGLKLITFDMTSFRTEESFDRFQDLLSAQLINNPFAIYLFEEIDKANIQVLDRLYFMLDEGVFYDRYQRPLFARGAYIMMTTNAGGDVILRERNNPDLRKLVFLELSKMFRESFLNRFDTMSIFKPFTDAEYMTLAKVLVEKKISKVRDAFEWNLSVGKSVIDFIGVNGRSDVFGARPMERLIENVITTGFTRYQLAHGPIPAPIALSINKAATGDRTFVIAVSGRSEVSYEVDLDVNPGNKSMNSEEAKLRKFFEGIRLYND